MRLADVSLIVASCTLSGNTKRGLHCCHFGVQQWWTIAKENIWLHKLNCVELNSISATKCQFFSHWAEETSVTVFMILFDFIHWSFYHLNDFTIYIDKIKLYHIWSNCALHNRLYLLSILVYTLFFVSNNIYHDICVRIYYCTYIRYKNITFTCKVQKPIERKYNRMLVAVWAQVLYGITTIISFYVRVIEITSLWLHCWNSNTWPRSLLEFTVAFELADQWPSAGLAWATCELL